MSAAVCKINNKKLKVEDVICPICREIYIEPISLPCKHIVCLQCLEKTVENNSLVCPICRTRIGTFIRLAKNLKKIVDQTFWERLKSQFPSEIRRKINGEEDGFSNQVLDRPPPHLAERGSIKEEFDEMFHKLKIEEEQSRLAEQRASEELARKIMKEELEQEEIRRRKTEEIEKSDALYVKSLIMSEKSQRASLRRGYEDDSEGSSSSASNDHDSISDELRHFTPICIAPKTPPKRLPNGKLRDTTVIKPINLSSAFSDNYPKPFEIDPVVENKMPLKVLSRNFIPTNLYPPPKRPPEAIRSRPPEAIISRPPEAIRSRPPEAIRSRPPEAIRSRPPEAIRSRPPEAIRSRPPEAIRSRPPEAIRSRPPEAVRSRPPEAIIDLTDSEGLERSRPPEAVRSRRPEAIRSRPLETIRSRPPEAIRPPEDMDMDDGVSGINSEMSFSSSDLNSNITDDLPLNIIKEQELIQKRIKQEQEDRAIALKLHNKWNKEKNKAKRGHGYQLRSSRKGTLRKSNSLK